MTLEQLQQDLQQQGVELWEEQGRLRYRAPAGVMDEARLGRTHCCNGCRRRRCRPWRLTWHPGKNLFH